MGEKKEQDWNNLNHLETDGAEKLKEMKIVNLPLSMKTTIETHTIQHNVQHPQSLKMRPLWH